MKWLEGSRGDTLDDWDILRRRSLQVNGTVYSRARV
jgi:hypothetical protein